MPRNERKVTLRVPADLYDLIEARARAHGMTVNEYTTRLVKKAKSVELEKV